MPHVATPVPQSGPRFRRGEAGDATPPPPVSGAEGVGASRAAVSRDSTWPPSGVVRDVSLRNGVPVATLLVRPSHLEVTPSQIPSLEAAWLLQGAIDEFLSGYSLRAMLIDARPMRMAAREINDVMWQWSKNNRWLDKVAVVNESAVMSIAVEMRAVAQGQELRGFNAKSDAVLWLCSDEPNTRRSLMPRSLRRR